METDRDHQAGKEELCLHAAAALQVAAHAIMRSTQALIAMAVMSLTVPHFHHSSEGEEPSSLVTCDNAVDIWNSAVPSTYVCLCNIDITIGILSIQTQSKLSATDGSPPLYFCTFGHAQILREGCT